ncbi:unnamed protein product [Hymenolepis diminuta]|uniref:Uncharacterized protein n=1 Tax=Hymenolepis diminuta TaxID=6216 RepID=A0A564ZAA6_HYMDI|nr:unnamed protein product [Hymenolepis diminuta]
MVPRPKRNLPDIYSRTYGCGKSRERIQPVFTCCQNPLSFYSYSIAETRFSQDSALTNHSGHTKGVRMHYSDKFTFKRVRCYCTLADNKHFPLSISS